LKKEQERKEFARDLVEMTQTERDSTIQNMMDGKTQSLEKKKKNVKKFARRKPKFDNSL